MRLAPLHMDHLEALLPIAVGEPELLKYSPSPFGSKANLISYFEATLEGRLQGHRYPLVIFDKRTHEFAGSTSFGNISNTNARLEIGWTWMGKKFQGTGLNQQIKFLMLQYTFESLGCERLEFKSDARNAQSRRAMEKIGATYEGLLRSHTAMEGGRRRDTVYYSILKAEWPGIRKSVFAGMK